jgi:tetratricopeptide (TPR) repeat protein
LAVDTGEGGIRLLKPGTDQEYAYLDDPQQNRQFKVPGGMTFTPNGRHLITVSNTGLPAIHLWDLQYLKEELTRLGLDNDLPHLGIDASLPEPPTEVLPHWEVDMSTVPLTPASALALYSAAIVLQPFNPVAYYQRALAYAALERDREAIADLEQAVALHSDWHLVRQLAARPSDLNSLAWACVAGPTPSRRMARVAAALAQRALELDESNANYLNTLGVAYFRNGSYPEALEALEKSLHQGTPRYAAYDLYFLAMCHHRLGKPALADEYFERACKSQQGNATALAPIQAAELTRFRREAEVMLHRQNDSPGP